MRIVGIISEYNPFHKGHQYHINKAREISDAEFVVCIMSGSFVQRGEPAMFDKWSRAKMAALNGADLVIELPFVYACQPAEIFAFGAVKILDALNSIDTICFGSESGDIRPLCKTAELLYNEPEDFKKILKAHLSTGLTYPKAISIALSSYLNTDFPDILNTPNNVLGIEYIKALMHLKSSIRPLTVQRVLNQYNDIEINHDIASATAIRHSIKTEGLTDKVKQSMPMASVQLIESLLSHGKQPLLLEDFSDMLLYRLRSSQPDDLADYLSVREGIENRLIKCAGMASSCNELIEMVKTKRYTRTYIQRLLCHILLGLKRQDILQFKSPACPSYVRVLAFNDKGKYLLKQIKEKTDVSVITKTADFKTTDRLTQNMFKYDLKATDIYSLGYKNLEFKKGGMDFYRSPSYV